MDDIDETILKRLEFVRGSRMLRILRLKSFAEDILESTLELYHIAKAEETPRRVTLIGLFGVVWVIVPYDGDFIPYLGWIDDATVLRASTTITKWYAPNDAVQTAEEQSLDDLAETVADTVQAAAESGKRTAQDAAGLIRKAIWGIALLLTFPVAIQYMRSHFRRRSLNVLSVMGGVFIVVGLTIAFVDPSHHVSQEILALYSYIKQPSTVPDTAILSIGVICVMITFISALLEIAPSTSVQMAFVTLMALFMYLRLDISETILMGLFIVGICLGVGLSLWEWGIENETDPK